MGLRKMLALTGQFRESWKQQGKQIDSKTQFQNRITSLEKAKRRRGKVEWRSLRETLRPNEITWNACTQIHEWLVAVDLLRPGREAAAEERDVEGNLMGRLAFPELEEGWHCNGGEEEPAQGDTVAAAETESAHQKSTKMYAHFSKLIVTMLCMEFPKGRSKRTAHIARSRSLNATVLCARQLPARR